MSLTEDKYRRESGEFTPMAVDTIRYLAPPTAVAAWLVILLALAGVPEMFIESALMGLTIPVSAIITSYLGLWTGFLLPQHPIEVERGVNVRDSD